MRRALVRTSLVLMACVGCCLGFVSQAAAHAALLGATPGQAANVTTAPTQLDLHYDEQIEPRFAVLSVTDVNGNQHAVGSAYHPPDKPDDVAVKLTGVTAHPGGNASTEGWYLVYWRVISADGHPVNGYYTFSVGPEPGPPPHFPTPKSSESAATPGLIALRAATLLAIVLAFGAALMRLVVARTPAAGGRRVLRHVSHVAFASFVCALVLVLAYVEVSTSRFAERSWTSFGAIFPLIRVSSFGRAWTDELGAVALTGLCVAVCVWLDTGERTHRTQASLIANLGALLAGAGAIAILGLAGHPAQTTPVWLSMILDFVHVAGICAWIGGLATIPYLALRTRGDERTRALTAVVPRFSRVALVSIIAIFASGIVATIVHMPTVQALWQTGYGVAILIKVALLLALMPIAFVNRSSHTPQLPEATAVRMLPRLVAVEFIGSIVIVVVAATLTSLAPPVSALASYTHPFAKLGPSTISNHTIHADGYDIVFGSAPNKAVTQNTYSVRVEKDGALVPGATAQIEFQHLEMAMQPIDYTLAPSASEPTGTLTRTAPAFIMAGKWGIKLTIHVPGKSSLVVPLQDQVNG